MSITSITIENFKGIRDRVKIDLKPITLLFGPNSGGKSTIIQAIHYAWEVIGRHNLDPNFTEFGGREIDLGGFENLVYGHDLSRSISIRLDMDLKGKRLPKYGDTEKRAFDLFYGSDQSMYDDNLNIARWNIDKREILTGWIEIEVSWCESVKKYQVSAYKVGLNNDLIAKVKIKPDGKKVYISYINFFHPLLVSINNDLEKILKKKSEQPDKSHRVSDILETVESYISTIIKDKNINAVKKLFTPDKHDMLIRFKKYKKYMKERDTLTDEFIEIWKKNENKMDADSLSKFRNKYASIKNKYGISDDYDLYAHFLPYEFYFFCIDAFGIKSVYEDLNIECSGLIDALPCGDTSFQIGLESKSSLVFKDKNYYVDALDSAIKQFIVGPGQLLKDELKKLCYLGPIRSRIPRNYVPNRYVEKRNWPDGLAAWDVLHKGDEKFLKDVDLWMADRLKSGYHITRKSYKEINISKITDGSNYIADQYNTAPTKTRLFLFDKKNNVEVQPPDVGVGISQVIPVIVMALYFKDDFKDGIRAIEQPELHIHPALQVTLGDLFISQINKNKITFLLETHSEHLILRFLRRIRETNEGNLPSENAELKPDQLAIYYVEPGDNGLTISQIRVDKEGEFLDRWPRGFFNERVEELY